MKALKKTLPYLKNILLPCLVFSAVTGVLTGLLIFLFKLASSRVILLSAQAYALVRQNPWYVPLLVLSAGALGLLAAWILRVSPNCRGGGIPTSIALLRGLIEFQWIKSVVLLFASSMLTYLCGVPLGNEGPSVQMGTAVGRGTVRLFAKKHRAWDRYIMTGGACAGFAAATGAPITGIFFAFEEAHRRFSPTIFMSAAMTVIFGSATNELLCRQAGISVSMFGPILADALPLRFLWVAIFIGIVCGACAIGFTKVYRICGVLLKTKLRALPFTLKVVAVFVAVSLIGLASGSLIGSGHDLVHELLHGAGVWYLLILYFCVRAILLIVANNVGVTGGLFVPSLAFGAILGALCARALMFAGLLGEQYYAIAVVIGMVSFLAASSRTPITAITFAAEALCGFLNILPITAGVTFAFLTIEMFGVIAFNETVLEGKVETENAGKTAHIVNSYLTVREGSFAVGKEIRDILWPPTCVVLSVDKNPATAGTVGISAGDVLHLHYRSYDPPATQELLEALVGEQMPDPRSNSQTEDAHRQVPENS